MASEPAEKRRTRTSLSQTNKSNRTKRSPHANSSVFLQLHETLKLLLETGTHQLPPAEQSGLIQLKRWCPWRRSPSKKEAFLFHIKARILGRPGNVPVTTTYTSLLMLRNKCGFSPQSSSSNLHVHKREHSETKPCTFRFCLRTRTDTMSVSHQSGYLLLPGNPRDSSGDRNGALISGQSWNVPRTRPGSVFGELLLSGDLHVPEKQFPVRKHANHPSKNHFWTERSGGNGQMEDGRRMEV